MPIIKSIHTTYSGYAFRSRLEARHAIFADSLAEPWQFEPDYILLPNGYRYLPDFWLPRLKTWLEVKGREPTDREIEKARQLAEGSNFPVVMSCSGEVEVGAHADQMLLFIPGALSSEPIWWRWCEACNRAVLGMECVRCGDSNCSRNHLKLMAAARAARSARFEFGQRGAVNPDRLDPAWKSITGGGMR